MTHIYDGKKYVDICIIDIDMSYYWIYLRSKAKRNRCLLWSYHFLEWSFQIIFLHVGSKLGVGDELGLLPPDDGAGGPGLEDLVLEAGAELAEVLLDVLVEVAVEQRVGAGAGEPQQVGHHEARPHSLPTDVPQFQIRRDVKDGEGEPAAKSK